MISPYFLNLYTYIPVLPSSLFSLLVFIIIIVIVFRRSPFLSQFLLFQCTGICFCLWGCLCFLLATALYCTPWWHDNDTDTNKSKNEWMIFTTVVVYHSRLSVSYRPSFIHSFFLVATRHITSSFSIYCDQYNFCCCFVVQLKKEGEREKGKRTTE